MAKTKALSCFILFEDGIRVIFVCFFVAMVTSLQETNEIIAISWLLILSATNVEFTGWLFRPGISASSVRCVVDMIKFCSQLKFSALFPGNLWPTHVSRLPLCQNTYQATPPYSVLADYTYSSSPPRYCRFKHVAFSGRSTTRWLCSPLSWARVCRIANSRRFLASCRA